MSVTRVQLVGNVSTGASFVGVVTATSFIGNVTGNASYASVAGVATYASVAGVSTYASVAGAPGGGGGTAALPAIAFDGDPNTGIYSPGADQLAVATNGTGRLFINSTGLVGIGTSSVGARFHIEDTDSSSAYSTASILGTQTSVYKQIVHTNQSTGTNEAGIVLRAGTSSNIAEWGISALRTGATSGDLIFRSRTGASTSAEFMRLTSTGLGIGTTPSDQGAGNNHLQVHSSSTVSYFSLTNSTTGTNAGSNGFNAVQLGVDTYLLNRSNGSMLFLTNGNERGRFDTSGRLLIGTSTAPSVSTSQYSLLKVQGNTSAATTQGILNLARGSAASSGFSAGADIGVITFTDNTGNDFAQITASADGTTAASDYPGRLSFFTTADGASSPTERMRIGQDGMVAIASSAGNVNIGGSTGSTIWASDSGKCGIHFGASALASTNSSGTPTDNVISLGLSGYRWSVVYAGTGAINTSDASLKQDAKNLDTAELNVATRIKGLIKKFRFIDAVTDKGDNARIHVGVIAQEVEQAFVAEGLDPRRYALFCEDTLEDGSKRLGIRYDELLAFVIAAL
jgi:hypothetical protein